MSSDKKPSKPVDLYVRVSRVGGRAGDSFISPEVQEERCRAMAKAKGYKVGEVFIDLDQSGGKMSRPEFDKMLERVREGVSGGVVVHKLDRFARNTRGLLETVDEIERHGSVFICIEPGLDTADPVYGRFTLELFGAIAALELRRIGAAWATAHEKHIARGVPTGRAPAGYRKDESGRLVVAPEHAEAVVEAFKLRATGGTWAQVRDLLNQRGVPTSGGKPWVERTASRLLGNRTLLGEVRFGSLVQKDAHEPLPGLSEALFRRVQRTRSEPAYRARKEPALLAGILRCAVCGGRMTLDTNRRNGASYRFYRCRSEHHANRPTIGAQIVDEYLITQALEHVGTVWGEKKLGDDAGYAEAKEALEVVRAEIHELDATYQAGESSAVAYAKARTLLEREEEEALDALAQAAEAGTVSRWYIPGPSDPDFEGWTPEDFAEAGIGNTRMAFDQLPVEKQRLGLASIVKEARVSRANGNAGEVAERVEVEFL